MSNIVVQFFKGGAHPASVRAVFWRSFLKWYGFSQSSHRYKPMFRFVDFWEGVFRKCCHDTKDTRLSNFCFYLSGATVGSGDNFPFEF